jgi:hypothetical protein
VSIERETLERVAEYLRGTCKNVGGGLCQQCCDELGEDFYG